MSEAIPQAALLKAVSDALCKLALEAEAMGAQLCMDSAIVANHIERLQDIDRITQSLRELSTLLVAKDSNEAMANIRLGDLQRELSEACAA